MKKLTILITLINPLFHIMFIESINEVDLAKFNFFNVIRTNKCYRLPYM